MIPKIIHYCWFGGEEIPEEYQKYIIEWQQLHPEWEIKLWNEENSPTNNYLSKALQNKNWSNCSNFIRLWALKEIGGVYLDTDFKLIKPLDPFLKHKCFLGFEEKGNENTAFVLNNAILGAVKNNPFIKFCYKTLLKNFDGTERSDLSGPDLTTKVLKSRFGLSEYGLQTISNITLYPTEYFYPIHVHQAYLINKYSEHIFPETVGIHMWGRSWVDKKTLIEIVDYLNFKVLNQEEYIKKLEKDYNDAISKSNEIWHWKVHFENEYNNLIQKQAPIEDQLTGMNKKLSAIMESLSPGYEQKDKLIYNLQLDKQNLINKVEKLKLKVSKLEAINQKSTNKLPKQKV